MGSIPLLALPLLLLLAAAAALDLGQVDVSQLRETRVCKSNKLCTFDATVSFVLNEQALTADGVVKTKNAKIDLDIEFRVTSQCGAGDNRFYRLDITKVSGTDPKRGLEAGRYPLFFSQSAHTGDIETIFTASREKKGLKRLKAGLVRSLAKHIRQDMLGKAHAEPVSYVFEGEDVSGKFVAHHQLRAPQGAEEIEDAGPNGLVLVETRTYTAPGVVVQKSKLKTKKVISLGGQTMKAKQKEKTKLYLTADGEAAKVKVKDRVSVGTIKPSAEKPTEPEPSLGKTKGSMNAVVRRLKDEDLPGLCAHASSPTANTTAPRAISPAEAQARFEADIEVALGKFNKEPANTPDDGDDDIEADPLDPTEALLQAEDLLANGNFDIEQVSPLMQQGTVKLIMDHAWRLYHDGALNAHGMQVVLGSLSGVRCTAAYDALLDTLRNRQIPEILREQAVISLLHSEDEDPAPAFVCNEVSDIVKSEGENSNMGLMSTMLLGALLDRENPEADGVGHHLGHLRVRLSQLQPNDEVNADIVVSLLGALGNAGNAASQTYVMPFVDSPIRRVRLAALQALHRLESSSERVRGAAAMGNVAEVDPSMEDITDSLTREHGLDGMGSSSSSSSSSSLFSSTSSGRFASSSSSSSTSSAATALLQETMGGSTTFIDQTWNVAGNKDFDVKGVVKSGASWSSSTAGASGEAGLTGRVYDVSASLIKASFSGSVGPSSGGTGTTGSLQVSLSVAGHVVASKNWGFEAPDLQLGGSCPTSLGNARGATRRAPVMFNRELLSAKARFTLAFIPMSVSAKVAGAIGYRLIFAAYLNCKSAGSENDIGLIAGASGLANAKVTAECGVDIGVASAGVGGSVVIFDGEVPAYAIALSTQATAKVDLNLKALSGRLFLYANAFGRHELTILDWNGPAKSSNMFTRSMAINAGAFIAGRKDGKESGSSSAASSSTSSAATTGSGGSSGGRASSTMSAAAAAKQVGDQVSNQVKQAAADAKGNVQQAAAGLASQVNAGARATSNTAQTTGDAAASAARTAGNKASTAANAAGNKAAAAAGKVKTAVSSQAERDRSTVSTEAQQSRSTTRENGKDTRATTRSTSETTQKEVSSSAQTVRSTVRDAGSKDRATERRAEEKIEINAAVNAQRERDQIRVEEARFEEKAAEREHRLESEIKGLGKEMTRMEDEQRDSRMRRMMRRETDKVTKKDDEIESQLHREDERNRFREVEQKDEKGIQSVKDQLHREDEREQTRRQIGRVDDTQRRDFEKIDERDQFKGVREAVRDEKGQKETMQRQFDGVENQMQREAAEKSAANRENRAEDRVEKAMDEKQQVEKDIAAVGQEVQQGQAAERQDERRATEQMEEANKEAGQAGAAEQMGEKIMGAMEKAAEKSKNAKQMNKLAKAESKNAKSLRQQGRRQARSLEKQNSRRASEDRSRDRAKRGREQVRRDGKRSRQLSRREASRMTNAASRERRESRESQKLRGLRRTAQAAGRRSREADRKVLRDVNQSNRRAERKEREIGRQTLRTTRREQRDMRRDSRQVASRVARNSRRTSAQNRRQDSRMERRDARQGRKVERGIRKETNTDKQERNAFRRRMDRRSERRKETEKQDASHWRNREKNVDKEANASLSKAERHDRRRLGRRAARNDGKFNGVANREITRIAKLKQSLDNRLARRTVRKYRRHDSDRAHQQARLARSEARDNVRVAKQQSSFVRKEARSEDRAATGLTQENRRFNERTARTQAEFVAMTKPAHG